MPDVRFGGPDRSVLVAHGAGRLHHQAAECDHRHVAGADTLLGAIADRAHRFPHGDVLVRNPADAGEVALLHRGAVLTVKIVARPHAVEIVIDVDPPLQHIELAPRIGVATVLVHTVTFD